MIANETIFQQMTNNVDIRNIVYKKFINKSKQSKVTYQQYQTKIKIKTESHLENGKSQTKVFIILNEGFSI